MFRAVEQGKKMLVLLGAALVLVLAVACSSNDNDGGTPGSIAELLSADGGPEAAQLLRSGSGVNTGIWVNGTGKSTVDPDLGILSMGVEALADTASEARRMAVGAIDATIAVLKANNIEDRDMQTSQFSISPRYNTQEITRCTDNSKELEPVASPSLSMPAPGSTGGLR